MALVSQPMHLMRLTWCVPLVTGASSSQSRHKVGVGKPLLRLLFRANPFSRAGCFRNQIWMSAEGVATRSVEAKRSICDESLPPHGLCVLSPCSVGRPPCALGRQWRGLLRCALSIEAMAFVNQSKRDGQPLSPRCSGGRRRWHPFCLAAMPRRIPAPPPDWANGAGVPSVMWRVYNVLITAHAFLMIFFLIMPALLGGFTNLWCPSRSGRRRWPCPG